MNTVDRLMQRVRNRLLSAKDDYFSYFSVNETHYRKIAAEMLAQTARPTKPIPKPIEDRIIEDFWPLPKGMSLRSSASEWGDWLKKYIATRIERTYPEYIKNINYKFIYRIREMNIDSGLVSGSLFEGPDVTFADDPPKLALMQSYQHGALRTAKAFAKKLLTGKHDLFGPYGSPWYTSGAQQEWISGEEVAGFEASPDDVGPDDIESIVIEGPFIAVSWNKYEDGQEEKWSSKDREYYYPKVKLGSGHAILEGGGPDGWVVYVPKYDSEDRAFSPAD